MYYVTGVVPYSGYDGARLRYDWWNLTLLYGICGCQKVRQIIAKIFCSKLENVFQNKVGYKAFNCFSLDNA